MKRIRSVRLIAIGATLVILAGCVRAYEPVEIANVPLDSSTPVDPVTDFESVTSDAADLVHQELPEARLTSFMYEGSLMSLALLDGIMHFSYTERRFGFLQDQLLVGLVRVDVAGGTMSLKTADWTFNYPLTQAISLDQDVEVSKIASLAGEHIARIGIPDCYVRLLYSGANWQIVCFPPGSNGFGERLCDFRIDATSGEVTND